MLVEILAKTLKSHWDEFREEIGLWIPVAILNKEHDDKPEGEEEFGTMFTLAVVFSSFLESSSLLFCRF